MPKLSSIYGFWREHDGKKVVIRGSKHVLRVDFFMQKYPYEAEMVRVFAVPTSKTSKNYREIRALLGDDWSIDVLESDIELQSDIIKQCQ